MTHLIFLSTVFCAFARAEWTTETQRALIESRAAATNPNIVFDGYSDHVHLLTPIDYADKPAQGQKPTSTASRELSELSLAHVTATPSAARERLDPPSSAVAKNTTSSSTNFTLGAVLVGVLLLAALALL